MANLLYITLKNENTTLNQASSNKANCLKEYLEIIVQGFASKSYIEFSNKQMKLWLTYKCEEKTVRKMTKDLLKAEIIELAKIGSKGEKFYKIKNYSDAKALLSKTIVNYVYNRKHSPEIRFVPVKPGILKNLPINITNNFLLELQINGKTQYRWLYPKNKYYDKICPICSDKLIDFKHGTKGQITHDLDKKCIKCKSKFYYNRSSEIHHHDDKIIISANESVRQFLQSQLVSKEKMKLLNSAAKKFLSDLNPENKKFFEEYFE